MKINAFINEGEEEKFFKDKIINLTSMQNSFLQMPTMICFNFCLKEMLDLCNVNSETGNKKYFELAQDFIEFLKKDIILKELDMGTYINIIKKIKEFLDNRDKINCLELYNYFSHVKTIFGKKYIDKLIEVILQELQECTNYKKLEILIETLINELLSLGYTYKFLNEIVKSYIYDNIFETPSEFIDFLFNSKENYDIYIPLVHFNDRDERFLKNSFKAQDVQLGKNIKIEGKNFYQRNIIVIYILIIMTITKE